MLIKYAQPFYESQLSLLSKNYLQDENKIRFMHFVTFENKLYMHIAHSLNGTDCEFMGQIWQFY